MAKQGKNVLLVERGITAGSKNVSGGRLYTYALEMLEPGMYKRAPLQRKVVREQIMMLGQNTATTIDYVDYGFGEEVPQSYTVLRAPLDEWFAAEAETAGAMVASGILVDELLEKDGKIVGIKAGEDEMLADVVVAADGVNSLLAQRAGLFPDVTAKAVGVGVKEVIELPDEEINSRFNVSSDEGAARIAIGCTEGISGGAFLYTNKGSISLGIVFNPEQAAKHGRQVHDIFRTSRCIPSFWLCSKAGPPLSTARIWSRTRAQRGATQASPRRAGGHWRCRRVWHQYRDHHPRYGLGDRERPGGGQRGDPRQGSARNRPPLHAATRGNAAAAQYAGVRGMAQHLEHSAHFRQYPHIANDSLKFMFTVDGKVPEKMTKAIWHLVKQNVSFSQLVGDGWKAYRSI